MPTAIRDIDLSALLAPVQLDNFNRCMLVFRWRGVVIGRQFVDVESGWLSEADVARAAERCGPAALSQWVADTIGYDERRWIGASPLRATVAICTRDRPDDLERALRGVTALHYRAHEILVVDNAPPTDRTFAVVKRFPEVRYICEPRVGLNVARNRAVREATGDVVAFTDDDAVPEPAWLDALVANFSDPQVLCVTGLTLPAELETDAQELFELTTSFARGFQRRRFDGQHDNPLHVAPAGAGANMAMRRSAISIVGPFDERLDGGMPTRSGGDHEMFARILTAGYRIVYDPAAVSWHRHRRSYEELIEAVRGYGVGVYAMWTGLLVERRELGVIRLAWAWFQSEQLPELWRMIRRAPVTPASRVVRACFRGCFDGPRAWFAARRLRPTGSLR